MITLIPGLDLCKCHICDAWTPVSECRECGETHCSICLDAYGCAFI